MDWASEPWMKDIRNRQVSPLDGCHYYYRVGVRSRVPQSRMHWDALLGGKLGVENRFWGFYIWQFLGLTYEVTEEPEGLL